IIWINRFNKDFNSTLRVSSDGVSVVANSSGVPVPLSDDVQARITRNRESAFLKLRATRNRRAAVLKLRATRNHAALLKLRKRSSSIVQNLLKFQKPQCKCQPLRSRP